MKKSLISLVLLLFICTPAFAQNRGVLTNYWASWVSVSPGVQQTMTLPANSRDIWIQNGSSIDVFVDLRGNTINTSGYSAKASALTSSVFQLDGPSEIQLFDVITNTISFKTAGATASPVSVVVTY